MMFSPTNPYNSLTLCGQTWELVWPQLWTYFLQLQVLQVQSGPHWQLSPQLQVVIVSVVTMHPQRVVFAAIVS